MASVMEIKVVQNSTYAVLLQAKKLPPEEGMKLMETYLRSGMDEEQVAYCEKLANNS